MTPSTEHSEPTEPKLSGAELKKRAKAEKTARRAAVKATSQNQAPRSASPSKKLPTKSTTSVQSRTVEENSLVEEKPKLKHPPTEMQVTIFSHLYKSSQGISFLDTSKDVHPAVLSLALQIKNFVLCGSNARCVGMLLAFKRVIESYTTPTGHALSRHLTTVLNAQVAHLIRHSRPLSVSQGNAIRQLKLTISRIDPSLPESTAKSDLLQRIDNVIRERITVADTAISRDAGSKIRDGEVIMTYGKSSIVEKTFLEAHRSGKKFKVLIVDSRPLFEGKNLARRLSAAGIETEYALITTCSHAISSVTKVFLGAHAMTSNGCLYSRVGTALVAMMAKRSTGGEQRPVVVLCETIKFTSRTPLDSIVGNEIADPEMLVDQEDTKTLSYVPPDMDAATSGSKKGADRGRMKDKTEGPQDEPKQKSGTLQGWKNVPNLQLLNILFDVTPAAFLDMIITEQGSLPPSSVSVMIAMEESRNG
ncbi:MAG: hypothetical protein Q9227_005561 [Pyrenula ochraceoflavens]